MSRHCLVCYNEVRVIGRLKKYTLHRCQNCGLVFSDPMEQADREWYTKNQRYEDYNTNPDRYGLTWGHLEFLQNGLDKLDKRAFILDYGCGNGLFLKTLKEKGFRNLYGFDFDFNAIASCKNFGLKNCYQDDKKIKNRKYDVITAFDLLEHVESPNSLMETFHLLLKEDGFLAISVPNQNRRPDTITPQLDQPPHHLTRWSTTALQTLIKQNGFECLLIKEKQFSFPELLGWLKLRFGSSFRNNTVQEKRTQRLSSATELRIKNFIVKLANLAGGPCFWLLNNLLDFKGHSIFILARKKSLPNPT